MIKNSFSNWNAKLYCKIMDFSYNDMKSKRWNKEVQYIVCHYHLNHECSHNITIQILQKSISIIKIGYELVCAKGVLQTKCDLDIIQGGRNFICHRNICWCYKSHENGFLLQSKPIFCVQQKLFIAVTHNSLNCVKSMSCFVYVCKIRLL